MSDLTNTVERLYEVVVNDEEQYSILLVGQTIPKGWRSAETQGDKESCLAYINDIWINMRPLSLRR